MISCFGRFFGLTAAAGVALMAGCGQPDSTAQAARRDDFTLTAAPGTNTDGAIDKFKVLIKHCPGIKKYKADIAKVEYTTDGHADFMLTVADKTTVLPGMSYATGHTCHFSVDDTKATASKRPCAWLCTGEDMTGIDGSDHAFTDGKLIGPLVRPWATLREAIAATRNEMTDIHGSDVSLGTAKLAIWGIDHMRWPELMDMPAGKYALVMKDSDAQRGSRICTGGQVIEISVDNSIPGKKVFMGGLVGDAGHLYRFIALHSTGDIVADSRAKFCGIVTGQQHYPNSMGGVAHAVQLVGMFDLPENKSR